MQVYRSQFPETAYSSSTFETPYEYQLQQQGLFHKVSLHGSFAASVIMGHVPEGTTSVSAVLLVNWKAGDQITVFPSMAEVRFVTSTVECELLTSRMSRM